MVKSGTIHVIGYRFFITASNKTVKIEKYGVAIVTKMGMRIIYIG